MGIFVHLSSLIFLLPHSSIKQIFINMYKDSSLKTLNVCSNNKRPMGHNAQLKKNLFISIKTYDYKCWLRGETTHFQLYENWMFLHLNKLESLSPKDALCQVCLKLVQWFCWKRFKSEKYTTTTMTPTTPTTTTTTRDKFGSEKPTWAFSSGELKIVDRRLGRMWNMRK